MLTIFLRRNVPLSILALALLTACGGTGASDDPVAANLNATLWMQQSPEYWALTTQTYAMAADRLNEALADPSWTAALEQGPGYEGLPPAVILDIDDTVLESTTYTAGRMQAGVGYTLETWTSYLEAHANRPVPGARAFCDYALSRGVAIFFVTGNRDNLKEILIADLRSHGFPAKEDGSNLYTRSDVRDKGPRRALIARDHRILLIIGDDGNDFAPGLANGPLADRQQAAEAQRDFWGRQWIVLPNPMYGTWENSLLGDPAPDSPQGRYQAKFDRLESE